MKYVIDESQAGRKLDSILRYDYGFSKSLIARLKHRPGSVTLDGAPARMTDRPKAGSAAEVRLDEPRAEQSAVCARSFVPQILYESESLLVINKPAGVKTHPAFGGDYTDTVAAAVSAYLGGAQFHPVTRLDKGTSGAMLIAKSGYAHSLMQKRLHSGELLRVYLAVTMRAPEPAQGIIELPLAREEGSARRIASENGVRAVTHYRVLRLLENGTALVALRLETGRTHQIRAHMSAIGCPLAGDTFYGGGDTCARPALHSYRLRFRYPLAEEYVELTAPPPSDFLELLGGECPPEDVDV